MKKSILFSSFLISLVTNGQNTDSRDEQLVQEVQVKWLQALEKKDIGAVQFILADNFFFIDADGKNETKNDILSRWKLGSAKDCSFNVCTYNTTAKKIEEKIVLTGMVLIEEMENNEWKKDKRKYVDTFIKVNGSWKLVSSVYN